MNESVNPYQVSNASFQADTSQFDPAFGQRGHAMLSQLTVLGILQIVQGALELFMSSSLIIMAFIFPMIMAQASQNSKTPMPASFIFGLMAYYGIAGGITLIFGILRIVAGSLSFWFRGRMLMWISLFGGLASCLTFYCSITSIALAIYGTIVMKHPAIKHAFQLAKSGMLAKQIREKFGYAYFHQTPG